MTEHNNGKWVSGIFITFSGNCRKALTLYQTCFGGTLRFETFEAELQGYKDIPVVSGTLVADSIIIYGSDLVHDEGRRLGNTISIFLLCKNPDDRKELIQKLKFDKKNLFEKDYDEQQLIEITDAFGVRWVLSI